MALLVCKGLHTPRPAKQKFLCPLTSFLRERRCCQAIERCQELLLSGAIRAGPGRGRRDLETWARVRVPFFLETVNPCAQDLTEGGCLSLRQNRTGSLRRTSAIFRNRAFSAGPRFLKPLAILAGMDMPRDVVAEPSHTSLVKWQGFWDV